MKGFTEKDIPRYERIYISGIVTYIFVIDFSSNFEWRIVWNSEVISWRLLQYLFLENNVDNPTVLYSTFMVPIVYLGCYSLRIMFCQQFISSDILKG
jgi:hypothetical protein